MPTSAVTPQVVSPNASAAAVLLLARAHASTAQLAVNATNVAMVVAAAATVAAAIGPTEATIDLLTATARMVNAMPARRAPSGLACPNAQSATPALSQNRGRAAAGRT